MAVLRLILDLLLVSSLTIALATSVHSAEAESGFREELNGRWLVVDSVSNSQHAILDVSRSDGDWSVNVVDCSQLFAGKAGAKCYVATSRDAFHLLLTSGYVDLDFRAKLNQDAVGDTLSGPLQLQHPQIPKWPTIPARLERTTAHEIAAPKPRDRNGDKPDSEAALLQILARSESLWSERRFGPLHLQLARNILQELRIDEFTEEVLWAHQRLADAAMELGETELAASANQQIAELKSLISQETEDPELTEWKQVEVTRDAGEDRVVLLELFTGASCGACNAADQAYGALVESFQPSEHDGGIGITSHSYVVRAMLGGPKGHAIVDGKASVTASISVEDLRRNLMAYLKEYPSTEDARGEFNRSLPEIRLKDLSVVAFVQDDSSKDILHTVIVPIESPGR